MAQWRWILGPAAGGHTLELTGAQSRTATWRLTDSHEASFGIDGATEQAGHIEELATDLHVLHDGLPLFRGRIGPTSDDLDEDTHRVPVTAHSYKEVLNRRRLYADSTLTYAATDQASIAWQLISQTQARTGGNLGIIRGLGQTTSILRDRTYSAGDSIGELLQQLSEVINGFDWDITPIDSSQLALDIWYPQRGADRGVVLERGGSLVNSVRRVVDAGTYANALRMTGDDALTAQTREAADLATRAEGRWDAVIGDVDIKLQATLNDRADWYLEELQTITPVYTWTLRNGAWGGPTHIWLGDTVQARIRSGQPRPPRRLDVDEPYRVYEIQVSPGPSGEETVQITTGGPRPNPARKLTRILRRLNTLEKR